MNDRPSADELLEAVREYLLTEVAPAVGDHRARFRALIAANVLAIVRRELARGGPFPEELAAVTALLGEDAGEKSDGDPRATLLAANRRLARHIRAGGADSPEQARAVREVVRAQVESKLLVNNPAFLERFRT